MEERCVALLDILNRLRTNEQVDLKIYDREMPEAFDPEWNWREQNQYFQERFCARLITELKPCSNVLYEIFNEGEWYDREQRQRIVEGIELVTGCLGKDLGGHQEIS